ncbi:hypothetical protein G7046_g2020 [Stylonectria norvegica]|nr:hypothetical protein G7046_g2020 [Stylonectria norvegica]
MAPSHILLDVPSRVVVSLGARTEQLDPLAANNTREQIIVEAWGQGFMVGAIVLLILLVLCNYRKGILLHKLIVLELLLAMGHCIFIFFDDPTYGWVLSATATPLYISYTTHNIISWIKIKPFLPRWGAHTFIITLIIVQPYWILECWANFEYFNLLGNDMFEKTRLLEPLMRDPWWVFTTVKLVLVINKNYDFSLRRLIQVSPRFGVMLLCLFLSIVFLVTDVAFIARGTAQSGINPFWRLALVFKCASDVIFLDDFKSVLDRIAESALRRFGNYPYGTEEGGGGSSTTRNKGSNSRWKGDARQVVTVSASAHRRGDGQKYGDRAGWPERRLTSVRSANRDDEMEMDNENQQSRIRVKTTIAISEEEGVKRKVSSSSSPRYGSQDNILPVEDLTSPIGMQQSQRSIPMMPMRARTKDL